MPIYSSDSDAHPVFGNRRRRRPLRHILGRGIVGDILMWKHKKISGGIVIVGTLMWFLLQVEDYNMVSLVCYTIMALMSILFLWSNIAPALQIEGPRMDQFEAASDEGFRYLLWNIKWFGFKAFQICSGGSGLSLFLGTIGFLWMLSVVGNYVSSLNLLYLGFICMLTIPALYVRYEREVDYIAGRGSQDARKLYNKFDSKVLNKIPRGPTKHNTSFY